MRCNFTCDYYCIQPRAGCTKFGRFFKDIPERIRKDCPYYKKSKIKD
jgi:hypothetical protein